MIFKDAGPINLDAEIHGVDARRATELMMQCTKAFLVDGVSWDPETGVASIKFLPVERTITVLKGDQS